MDRYVLVPWLPIDLLADGRGQRIPGIANPPAQVPVFRNDGVIPLIGLFPSLLIGNEIRGGRELDDVGEVVPRND
jgi:hypothetical protein